MNNYGYRAETIRALNRKLIFDLVASHGPISRSEIAQRLRLSFTAVTDILKDLIQANLVRELQPGASQGGRPPSLIDICSDTFCLLGLDFDAVSVQCVLSDGRGGLIGETILPIESPIKPESVTARLLEASHYVLRRFQGERRLLTFGIACSSPVGWDNKVHFLESSGWLECDLDILDDIEKALGLPGIIDNDANMGAYAELRLNASSGEKDIGYILIHRGVGAGIISEGKIFRGHANMAGEFGHIVIDPDGPRCSCGRFGCLESLASIPCLMDYVVEAIKFGYPTTLADLGKESLTVTKIVDAGLAGDKAVLRGFEELGKWLSLGVVNLVHLLNPEVVVFGGALARAGERLLDPIETITRQRLLPDFYAPLKFRTSSLGMYGPALGAALYALDALLEGENL